jgi:hypothetical protein
MNGARITYYGTGDDQDREYRRGLADGTLATLDALEAALDTGEDPRDFIDQVRAEHDG